MESITYPGDREMIEHLVGHMIQSSIKTGIVRKDEMIVILEDMIQSVERGTLEMALEHA